MLTSLIVLATTSTLLALSAIGLAMANQRLLRRERRRSDERSEADRLLIEALQENAEAQERNAAAQARRADAAEDLAEVQRETIRLLHERIGLFEGTTGIEAPRVMH